MAITIDKQILVDNNRRAVIKIVGQGGTDANASLIDVSTLAYALNANGKILGTGTDTKTYYRTEIKRIWGQGQMTEGKYVTLKWNNITSNDAIVTFGTGAFNYNFDAEGITASITNKNVANGNGNIIFSSTAEATDAWTLFVDLKKDGKDYDQGQTRDPAAFNPARIP